MNDDLDRWSLRSGAAQRRHLTVLYCDLSDSTRLSAALETEFYAELLGEVRSAFKQVVEKHGGTINQYQGDGLQAFFGHPRATEDDGRRATEAALDVHELARDLRRAYPTPGFVGVSLHSGIHSGLTLAHEGDVVAGRYELFGPAPNIAKHLSDIAQSDEILVSEETLGAGSHFFQTSEQRALMLKGQEDALLVYQILGRTPVRTRFEARAQRGLVPFVGRRAEMKILQDALARTVAGRPVSVAICAPAGMGKTRLADEFLRQADAQCSIHRGYCEGYLSAEPLQPFLQMLRALFQLSPGTAAVSAAEAIERGLAAIDSALPARGVDLLHALSLAPPSTHVGSGDQPANAAERTTSAIYELFERLTAIRPQVLFIDDWQAADRATRQVADALRAIHGPLLLLVATRGFEVGDADMTDAEIVRLPPLSNEEATQTISHLLPQIDPFIADSIRRSGGGNPLFIEELSRSITSIGPRLDADRLHGGSASLEKLIEIRVASLPQDQAELICDAAVIGNVVPVWLLRELTGYDDQHPLVHQLAERDLLFAGEEGGTLRFKHGVTRTVVYDMLGRKRRREMHSRIAQLLRQRAARGAEEESYEALAYHYRAAGELPEAARYAELAGDKARAASSLDRARSQYRIALDLLDQLPPSEDRDRTWASIVRRLGVTSVFDPSRDEIKVFKDAVARARQRDDREGVAFSEYWLAYITYALGESRAAVEHCELALAAASELGNEPLIVQIRAVLGQARAAAGEYRSALRLLDNAISSKRTTGSRAAVGFAYSLACKASILGDRGEFAKAYVCFAEALDSVAASGHEVEGSVLCWRSGVYLWQGNWAAARQDAAAASRIAERVKSLYLFAMSRGLSGWAGWHMERDSNSMKAMLDASNWLEARDKGLFISLCYGWLAQAMVDSERHAEARHYASRALRRERKLDRIGAAMARRAMARAALRTEQWATAERHLGFATAIASVRGSPHEEAANQLCRAETALARRDLAAATSLLDQAAASFNAMQMPWHVDHVAQLRQMIKLGPSTSAQATTSMAEG